MQYLRSIVLGGVIAGLSVHAVAQPAACGPARLLSTQPLNINFQGMPVTTLRVEGRELSMLVDPLAMRTVITERAAGRLGLQPFNYASGYNNRPETGLLTQSVAPHAIEIGGTTVGGGVYGRYLVGTSIMIIPSGRPFGMFVGEDGILGQDLLAKFDVDLDFGNRRLNLYSPDHCAGQAVTWTRGPYAVIPYEIQQQKMPSLYMEFIALPVQLDGVAAYAIVSPESARSQMPSNTAGAYFSGSRFSSLALGSVTIADPEIRVFPGGGCMFNGKPCFALGTNILRTLHLYIAYKERTIYLTPADAR